MYRKLLSITAFSFLLLNLNESGWASALDPVDQATYHLGDSPQVRAKFGRLLNLNEEPQIPGRTALATCAPFTPFPQEITRLIISYALEMTADSQIEETWERGTEKWSEIVREMVNKVGGSRWLVEHGVRGHESDYLSFLKGELIYRPTPDSDEGMIRLKISDLPNPLDGTFDLSQCGDAGNYVVISTGYRKGIKPENDGELCTITNRKTMSKIEVWIAPRFLIEKNIATDASYLSGIMANWDENIAPVGVFFTWGSEHNQSFDYNTKVNLFQRSHNLLDVANETEGESRASHFFDLTGGKEFSISFEPNEND